MKPWPAEDQKIVEYLLGRLLPVEQAAIDERAFVDDGFEEQLGATTDDLIHAYLAGALASEDRAAFEEHFLASPVHRERFAFIKALLSSVDEVEEELLAPRRRPAPAGRRWWGLWAAALLLAAVTAGLLWRQPSGPEIADTSPRPDSPAPSGSPPSPPTATPTPAGSPSPPATRLAADPLVRLPRGVQAAPVEVRLPAAARLVRVEVPVAPHGPTTYDAVLRDPGGREVWRAAGAPLMRPEGPLVLAIPARLLSGGAYRLQVAAEQLRDASGPAGPPPREFTLRVERVP